MCINKPVLILFSVLMMLTGCASAPVNIASELELQEIPDAHGRIFVYRLNGDADRISSAVRVDGEPVGRAFPGSFFYVDLPAGDYEITAARNSDRHVSVVLDAGAVLNVRVDMWLRRTRWTLIPVLVPEETAKAQMSSLSLKGTYRAL
jgi:hypothetical protein